MKIIEDLGSLGTCIWDWVPEAASDPPTGSDTVPASTPDSTALARDLKRRVWTFVGPTTVYAFMQSVAMVNDHIEGCFARPECDAQRTRLLVRPSR